MIWWVVWQNPFAFVQQSWIWSSWDFIFDWFNISDCWEISVDTSNYDDMNRIDLDTYESPRTDWGWVLWYYLRWKIINIKVVVIKDTEEELNTLIDTMKLKLFKKEWILKIRVNWKYRQAKCNLTSLQFNRDFEKKTILTNVLISFATMENLHDENTTYNTEVWVNTPTLSLDINNNWARADYELYMIFWSGIVWTNLITIQKDWYTMTISQAISDWDILIIDWVEKQVTINGSQIDYDGPFVQLQNWSNPILVSINWTYIADITYLYYVNYL